MTTKAIKSAAKQAVEEHRDWPLQHAIECLAEYELINLRDYYRIMEALDQARKEADRNEDLPL